MTALIIVLFFVALVLGFYLGVSFNDADEPFDWESSEEYFEETLESVFKANLTTGQKELVLKNCASMLAKESHRIRKLKKSEKK